MDDFIYMLQLLLIFHIVLFPWSLYFIPYNLRQAKVQIVLYEKLKTRTSKQYAQVRTTQILPLANNYKPNQTGDIHMMHNNNNKTKTNQTKLELFFCQFSQQFCFSFDCRMLFPNSLLFQSNCSSFINLSDWFHWNTQHWLSDW